MPKPTTVPYKYYKYSVNGKEYVEALPGFNTPSGNTEIPFTEFEQKAKNLYASNNWGDQSYYDWLSARKPEALNPSLSSGYLNDNGVLTTEKAVNEQASQKAGIASGELVEISPGLTVPKGSAGQDLQAGGNTNSPTQPEIGVQFPSYDEALSGVYAKRSDLQQLYGPDGKALQPNDPRTASIPTLQDWARLYGVNEEPTLKTAQANPAGRNTPTSAQVTAPTQSTQPTTPSTPRITPEQQAAQKTVEKISAQSTLESYGVATTAQKDPVKYVQDVYSQVYGNLGVSAAKEQFDKYNKDLLNLRNEKTDKIVKINDDPWLTEDIRKGRIDKLEEKYAEREKNLLAYLTLTQDIYESGIQQAQYVAGQAIDLYEGDIAFDRQVALDKLNFNQQLESNAAGRSEKAADARYQIAQGRPFYQYEGTDLVYDTKTGKPLSFEDYKALGGTGAAGKGAFADVYKIPSSDKKAERALVLEMANKYYDAGIVPNDTLKAAQGKLAGSKIYQKQTRIPAGKGDSGNTTSTTLVNPITGETIDKNPKSTGKTITTAVQNAYNLPSNILENDYNQIRNTLLEVKNSGVPWNEAWGQIESWLAKNQLNPGQFQDLIADILYPGGFKEYKKLSQPQTTNTTSNKNPFPWEVSAEASADE